MADIFGSAVSIVLGNIKAMRNNLSRIKALLSDVEREQRKTKVMKDWLKKLRHTAYEAEDILDDIAASTRRGSKVSHFFGLPKGVLFHLKMAHKLKDVREKVDNIGRERSDFHLSERVEAVEDREVESKMTVAAEALKERERIREERRQERERERRLEAEDGSMSKKRKITRDKERENAIGMVLNSQHEATTKCEIETFSPSYHFLPQNEQCEESLLNTQLRLKNYGLPIRWEKPKSYYEDMSDKQEDQFFKQDMEMKSIISTKAKVAKLWEGFRKGIIKKPSLEEVDRRFVMEHYGKEALDQLQSSAQSYLPTLLAKLGFSEMCLQKKISNRPRSNPGITRIPDAVLAQLNELSVRQGDLALMTNYVEEVRKETNRGDCYFFAHYLREHGAGRLSREELEKAVMERFGPRVLQGLSLRMEMVRARNNEDIIVVTFFLYLFLSLLAIYF